MQAGDGAAAPMMVLRVLACTGTAVHDRCWREAPLLALEARRGANSCHVLATRACDAQGLKARTLPRFSHRRCGLRVAGAEQTSPVFIATITTTEAAGWAVDAPVAGLAVRRGSPTKVLREQRKPSMGHAVHVLLLLFKRTRNLPLRNP